MRLRANAICQREKTMFEYRSWIQLDGENRSNNDRMDSIFSNITTSKSMNKCQCQGVDVRKHRDKDLLKKKFKSMIEIQIYLIFTITI